MTTILCADCRTRPAVLQRGKVAVCVACYEEKPLVPLATWDRIINPAYILALAERVAKLEQKFKDLEADS